jgi:NTP pyrophosphatase (non-canonical NTP hydrolase)
MKPTEKILNHYGIVSQINKAIEELTELSLVLQHYVSKKATNEEVVDELADVLVMAIQLKHWFGNKEVAERFKYKIDRQLSRIERT